jgi:hypothetical protein
MTCCTSSVISSGPLRSTAVAADDVALSRVNAMTAGSLLMLRPRILIVLARTLRDDAAKAARLQKSKVQFPDTAV